MSTHVAWHTWPCKSMVQPYNVLAKFHKPTLGCIENLRGIMLSIWEPSTWLHKLMWPMKWFVNVEGKKNKQEGTWRFMGVKKRGMLCKFTWKGNVMPPWEVVKCMMERELRGQSTISNVFKALDDWPSLLDT